MGVTTFHPFPQLPGELRDLIWDHAVRPVDLRGVHYFSFYNTREVPEKIKSHLMPLWHPHQWEVLGAPLPDDDALTASWNHSKSTYAIDGALWTTCKESRAAMHRRYNLRHWTDVYHDTCRPLLNDLRSDLRNRHENHEDLPAIFPVHDINNWQYITVLPRRDLIMLQTWDVDDFSSLEGGHMFSSMHYGFVNFADIAVEFDPSWDYDELEEYQQEWIHGDLSYNFTYDRPRWATYRLYHTAAAAAASTTSTSTSTSTITSTITTTAAVTATTMSSARMQSDAEIDAELGKLGEPPRGQDNDIDVQDMRDQEGKLKSI
ncbi:hypothetical protein QIS74_06199 [Colletotrichum tabaci]|uniref:2EXR domain-containing protein n=1 Tax=Colletotrichum tabaci TaxID=1209068 RepID=A0AAV9TDS3_9PEZI